MQFITAQKLNSKRKALPKQRPKSKVYECGLCDFFTWNSNHMENHNICHQRNRKIKCPLCSFSSDSKCGVSVHLNRHHRRLPSTLDDNKNGSSQELLKVMFFLWFFYSYINRFNSPLFILFIGMRD